jgi:hypothetical protein
LQNTVPFICNLETILMPKEQLIAFPNKIQVKLLLGVSSIQDVKPSPFFCIGTIWFYEIRIVYHPEAFRSLGLHLVSTPPITSPVSTASH